MTDSKRPFPTVRYASDSVEYAAENIEVLVGEVRELRQAVASLEQALLGPFLGALVSAIERSSAR